MISVSFSTPDEHYEEDYNKDCERLGCQEIATKRIDLPFGEYESTLFYFCKNCLERIENMESK